MSLRGSSTASGFETFEHGADVGIRGWGATMEQAFAQGARAMFSLMCDDIAQVSPASRVKVAITASEPDLMFLSWLNQLLAESDLAGILLCDFQLSITNQGGLEALVSGEPFADLPTEPGIEVKGATFTELQVRELEDGTWVAQCVVDV
jgi:SHS2 domain-containing protein